MGSKAGRSASGMCAAALLWKDLAGHLGKRAPKDLTAPLTWLTSCVRHPIITWRERTMAIWAWESSPLCLSGYKSFGSRRARRARFLRHLSGRSFACSGIDEPQFASIGHKDLVAALLEQTAYPGRVGSGLYGYTHRLLRGEAPPYGLGVVLSLPSSMTSPSAWSMRHK